LQRPIISTPVIPEFGSSRRDFRSRSVDFDVQMMRGSIAIVNEMEF
jgi:hypothetical protein